LATAVVPRAHRRRPRAGGDPALAFFVMAGLVPAIHVFLPPQNKAWMPGTRPGMTRRGRAHHSVRPRENGDSALRKKSDCRCVGM